MKKKYRCVVWDWNGTILDDAGITYEIAREMLSERGIRPVESLEAYRNIFRFPIREYYLDMGYTYETESYEEIADEFVKLYTERFPTCSLIPHAREVLDFFREAGREQILLSATSQENLEKQIRHFGLENCFDSVLGQKDDLAAGKAERGKAWFEEKGLSNDEIVFVGDTDHDFEVASSVDCDCILTDLGHQSRKRLEALGVPVIHDLRELTRII